MFIVIVIIVVIVAIVVIIVIVIIIIVLLSLLSLLSVMTLSRMTMISNRDNDNDFKNRVVPRLWILVASLVSSSKAAWTDGCSRPRIYSISTRAPL